MAGRFIVTTGRCGSTLLSELLREHPAVLSLSGFFTALHSPSVPAFPRQPITGAEFWTLLSTTRPETAAVWRRHCGAPPAGSGRARFGSPPLLMVAFPHLTDQPEALHEEFGAYVAGQPLAGCAAHYSGAFEWLCARFGRPAWVERSGGSTWFLADLLRCWPAARYVHLVRDGRNVAVSMSQRPGFRLAVLMADLQAAGGDGADMAALAARLAGGEPIELARFGEIWAQQVVSARDRLAALPTGQVLQLRYEDLVADPERELARLVEFFGLTGQTPPGWLRRSARRVERREPAWHHLPAPDQARLAAACAPGLRLLGYT